MDEIKLKFYEQSLGNDYSIEIDGLYFNSCIHDEWQMADDNSHEYKDNKFYTHNAHRILELIDDNFAELLYIDDSTDNIKYFFRMRKKY